MTEQPVGPRCGNNPNARLTDGDRKAVADFKARLALQASAKPYIERAVWVDGDPLMEVIAATLWKHCARDSEDMPQQVCDDPRTIAAFAAAVARAHAAVSVSAAAPPADRAALRDLLAEVLAARFTADGDVSQGMRVIDPGDGDDSEPARRVRPLEAADAVLAVLPPPADRAAVYADLIAKAEEWDGHITVQELRRLAAETQPSEPPWATDGARIGRVLIWSWASVGDTDFGQGYRTAQEDVRAILTRPLLGAEEQPEPEPDAPRREPHPTEADLRHALAVAAKFHGQDVDQPAAVPAVGQTDEEA